MFPSISDPGGFDPPCQNVADVKEPPAKKRKKCSKIHPSFIVLPNINPILQKKQSTPYSTFTEKFSECSNMCKKIHFRRRLYAGKDVFNVKVPSKQKGMELYLQQLENPSNDIAKLVKMNKSCQMITTDLVAKYDKLMKKKRRGSKRKYLSRVRRNILRVPKDFRMNAESKQKTNLDKGASEYQVEKMVYDGEKLDQHTRDLDTLKELIQIKRHANRKLYQIKKARQWMNIGDPLSISAGTKSFSGRIRKTNVRYKDDFATNRFDVGACLVQEDTKTKLRLLRKKKSAAVDLKEKIKKRVTSDVSEDKVKPEIEHSISTFLHITPKTEVRKDTPISSVKDTPITTVNESIASAHRAQASEEKPRKRIRGKRRKSKPMQDNTRNEFLEFTEKDIIRARNTRAIKNSLGDEVIIQYVPNENRVIQDLLLQTSSAQATPPVIRVPGSSPDTFPCARSLLTSCKPPDGTQSLSRQKINADPSEPFTIQKIKVEPVDTPAADPTDPSDKYKMLRIPESVQRLFNKTTASTIQNNPHTYSTNTVVIAPSNATKPSVEIKKVSCKTKLDLAREVINNAISSTQFAHPGVLNNPNQQLAFPIMVPQTIQSAVRMRQSVPVTRPVAPAIITLPLSKAPVTMQQRTVSVVPLSGHQETKTNGTTAPKVHTVQITLPKPPLPISPSPTLVQTQAIRPLTSSSTERGKFYLLKVEGKNFLIPLDNNPAQQTSAVIKQLQSSSTSVKATPPLTSFATKVTVPSAKSTPPLISFASLANLKTASSGTLKSTPVVVKPPVVKLSKSVRTTVVVSNSSLPAPTVPVHHLSDGSKVTVKVEVEDPEYAKAEGTSKAKDSSHSSSKPVDVCKIKQGTTAKVKTLATSPVATSSNAQPKDNNINPENETGTEQVEEPAKPKAFAEALTSREERLRKLKETLKEKQKAVEALRTSFNKS